MSTTGPVSKYDNAKAFAAQAVRDMLQAVSTTAKEARMRLSAENTTSTTHIGSGGFSRFVWVMIVRFQTTDKVSGAVSEHVWAHTNDGDLSIGTPMSLSVSVPLSQAMSLERTITQYLDGEIAGYGQVDALLSSVKTDGTVNPNFTGDSESGYANIVEQVSVDLV